MDNVAECRTGSTYSRVRHPHPSKKLSIPAWAATAWPSSVALQSPLLQFLRGPHRLHARPTKGAALQLHHIAASSKTTAHHRTESILTPPLQYVPDAATHAARAELDAPCRLHLCWGKGFLNLHCKERTWPLTHITHHLGCLLCINS